MKLMNKYPTNLDSVLEDLKWVNRNIDDRYLLDKKEDLKNIPQKVKDLSLYYNFRQNRLIGAIKRLSNYEKSIITEQFPNITKEVKELIIPAIKWKE